MNIQVFDPAQCCTTGVCGPSVDPQLARFAGDLEWLKAQGPTVQRFNLAQEPGAFAENAEVKKTMELLGEGALPLILADGKVKSTGAYPSREQLGQWAGLLETGEACTPSPTGKKCC